MTGQKPSVSRMVHYVARGSADGVYPPACRAAVITEVDEYQPGDVFNPEGLHFPKGVLFHEGDIGHDHTGAEVPERSYRGGTWHWPERV